MRTIAGYITAFLMWILLMALGLWIMVVSRDLVLTILALNVDETTASRWQAIFFDRLFVIVIGLVWLILMVVVDGYLRKGVEGRDIMVRFARFTGPMLLLLFIVDLCLFGFQNWYSPSFRLPILAAELIAGGLLFWRGRSPRKRGNPAV